MTHEFLKINDIVLYMEAELSFGKA